MELRVSAPGTSLDDGVVDQIERDFQKIDRRLSSFKNVFVEVRINSNDSHAETFNVVVELEYSRNHLIAKSSGADLGQSVRDAREELLRQINDRSRGSHSQHAKGR